MKKIVTLVSTLALLAVAAAAFAANAVRISQVYGGGGGGASTAATYNQDYVELFNSSNAPVNIGGWVIEYGSAAGNWGSSATNYFVIPANTTIQPCKYILVAVGAVSTNAAVPNVPAPDFTNTAGPSMSGTTGKVGLFNAINANLACGAELAGTLVDKVSYGTGNCPEVTNVGTLSTTTAAVRKNAGLNDTDNNLSDFTVTSNAVPHNSNSVQNPNCSTVGARTSTWGAVKQIYR